MALKRTLPVLLILASGGVAAAGYSDKIPVAAVVSFLLSTFAIVFLLTTKRETQNIRSPIEIAPERTPRAHRDAFGDDCLGEAFDLGLGITDPVTGMLNNLFFSGLVGTKVATARRRLWPISIALLHVSIDGVCITREAENYALSEFAKIIHATLRDADVACRVSSRTFALLLDDTDEDGAAWASERIQLAQARRLDHTISKVSAGIASYPSHGIEATDIVNKAREALERATSNADLPGLGLVIVAPQRPL